MKDDRIPQEVVEPHHDVFPMSFAQQRLWFLSELEPESAFYNIGLVIRLNGPLDIQILENCFNTIVRRHEILRTTFANADGQPIQIIDRDKPVPLKIMHVQEIPETIERVVEEEATSPFDLLHGPLIRLCLVRSDDNDHVLVITAHHIICDEWSTQILTREFAALYSAEVTQQPAVLPALAIQYADFAVWQRQWLSGPVLQQQLTYWTEQLAGAPPVLTLPTDRPRPPVQRYRGATQAFAIPPATVRGLYRVGQQAQATLFMTLVAAVTIVLARYSGQRDICLGTPIANRTRAELEPLIGFFVNTLVLRTRLDPTQSFLTVLEQVRTTALEAYVHQDLPFEHLVEALNPERQLSHPPLFQVLLVLQNAPLDNLVLPGLTLSAVPVAHPTAKFDLTFNFTEVEGQLVGTVEYNTDLFEAATIERLIGHFTRLLEAIVAEPTTRVSELTMLSPAERQQLLVDWNATAAEYPATQTIQELFEAQVARTPEAVAVVYEGQQLTYGALNARANQLARHLRTLGVGPDRLVGLCVERSLEMIVGLLGILKAGGAYVPLDPTYPTERLRYMLTDSQPVVVLTQAPLLATLPATEIPTFYLDTQWATVATYPSANLEHHTCPAHLAYVLYTSGSTGRPKGVALTQRSVAAFIHWACTVYGIEELQGVLASTSISFDLSVFELFVTLNCGGQVILSANALALPALPNAHDVTLLNTVPLAIKELLRQNAIPNSVRTVNLAGEPLQPAVVDALYALGHIEHVFDLYGPTEDTTYTTSVLRRQQGPVTIGRPIANTQIYIVDADLAPVPVGVAGELHIAGAGLARGYLGRPGLTAAKFVPNPFSEEPGARMYKSGDRARYQPDGNIEYLGRIDHQIKLRGFRIELGEIEAALSQHPGVREAVVVVREDQPGEQRLVAYVGVEGEALAIEPGDLRSQLAQTLPGYMVPSAFVVLEQFPLTPNGKVDRQALPAPEVTRGVRGYVAPRTPVEAQLAAIWAEVLQLDRVGVEDNFFELGGHSLLATRLLSEIRAVFQVEVPLRAVFEAPTVATFTSVLEQARQEQRGVLGPALVPIGRDAALPLSYAQQRLWFLDQLEPGQAFYNIPAAVRLVGELDAQVLIRVVQELVRRHEALRTTFPMGEGAPVQQIAAELTVAVPMEDLTALPAEERERRALAQAAAAAQTPFDLATGPLLRVRLLRLGATEHIVLFTLHHIVSDGWSTGVLVRDVAALYAAYVEGRPSPLPELAIQYADFAVWQRQWLSGPVLQQQLTYWTEQLAGAPPVLTLPTDRPRPPVQRYRGATQAFAIPPATVRGLYRVGQQAQATLFMTLVAAVTIVLARYSGQRDICLGTSIANRTRAELEPLIGFFVNTLVLRTRLDPTQSFLTVLEQVRTTALEAYAHQDLPFEHLVEALNPERQLSHPPLFQVLLVLQNAPLDNLVLPGLTLSAVPVAHPTAKFDLTFDFTEVEGQLVGTVEYNTDLFEAATIERLIGHFTRLLEAIVAEPTTRVSELTMLSPAERQQLLVDWNATAAEYPATQTIQELFEAQVARTPEAVAVVYEGQQLTYGALNARANQLARHLRTLGVGPDRLVGLCVERSLEMIVGLLGILKAGGAYVPLEPTYPTERLRYMLTDSQPVVVLTQAPLLATLPATEIPTFYLDTQWATVATYLSANLEHHTCPAHLAYVLYTSGSTGRPKGVGVYHLAIINFIQGIQQHLAVSEQDVFLAVTSLSFDIAFLELLFPLTMGARVELIGRGLGEDGERLATLVTRSEATIVQATPSTWRLLLATGWQPNGMLNILCGGEALSADLSARLRGPGNPLFNLYGPTETTIWSCLYGIASHEAPIPIGRPIANTQIYIVDADLTPVPVGVAGELHIAGAGLARGYLGRPGLTAAKFVPNPFSEEPGARMYKSGDRARYQPDGNIEYLGRIDHQIKLRGFRIELGEIEAALSQHPGVREAVVVVREDQPGEQRLVAYVGVEGEALAIEPGDLRSQLAQTLPGYMVPSAFVVLEQFPLTPNGKVDRQALPAPEVMRGVRGYVAPRTPVEAQLAAIWAEVLQLDRVGVEDNFFELGGHSLLATRLLSEIRAVFQVEVPLRAVFEAPTVATFTSVLEQARQEQRGVLGPALVPIGRDAALPLSYAQQRLWFLDQLEPGQAFYNIPAAVRLVGELDAQVLIRVVQELVRRHEALRTTFPMGEGAPVQQIAAELTVAVPMEDLTALPAEERERRALAQAAAAQTPFDLATGPLLRVRLLRLGATEHIVLFTLHHIVSDGWSLGVLVRDVAALYAAYVEGRPSPLPELAIQYADFAVWQRQWLSGPVLQQQLTYWTEQLAGAPPVLTLPTDRPRPPVQRYRGATQAFAIPPATVRGLYRVGQQAQATLFMTLVAAVTIVLARYSGQRDICLGTSIANRTRAELEPLIGFFVNTLVLRTRLDPTQSFLTVLEQVRTTALEAYAHQDLPFEHLVEALNPERQLSHPPLFQVLLVLQNAPLDNLVLPGLTLSAVPVAHPTAKFDLTFDFTEVEGQLVGTVEYNTDLFEAATIERLIGHFTRLLEAIVAEPTTRVSELTMLSPAERQQLLVDWNATAAEYPATQTIQELFEAQVARTPEAVAVVYEGQQLTYGALNARANQLARHLRTLGVGPDRLVGLCVERSLEMIVGLLGILKAGGAYVPLDPTYPTERLRYMLTDSQPVVVLTQAPLLATLPATEIPTFYLDTQWATVATYPSANLEHHTCPAHLAYVLYTSGSTGRPKGVALTQRSVAAFIHWACTVYGIEELQGVLASTSISFDLSVFELFVTLNCGGQVILSANALALPALPNAHDVTLLNTVPSAIKELLRQNAIPNSVRTVNLAGEPLQPAVVDALYALGHIEHVFDLYGPTEDTTYTTSVLRRQQGPVTIGRPIANTQIYIVDADLTPVPVGVAGELHIAGAGLARGYLGRPGLTAAKFVPNPFSEEPGARMYKSGDRARYQPDGNIEYLGRIDHQIKLRGFRIELGEIEAALSQHPGVREAVVVVREDQPGEQRLVAYVGVEGEALAIEPGDLRSQLAQTLPGYMVPSAFVVLEQFPLTPNGKVDRQALPAPEVMRGVRGYVAPRTPVEAQLAAIWAEVLQLDRVGVEDNFFELGGHSLLAITMLERLRQVGLATTVRALFTTPTIAAVAAAAGTTCEIAVPPNRIPAECAALTPDMLSLIQLTPEEVATIVATVPGGACNVQDIYPLAPLQEGLLFHHRLQAQGDAYLLPALLSFDTRERLDQFLQALQVVIARHDILRTAIVWEGLSAPVQVVWRQAPLTIEEILLQGDERAQQLQARYDLRQYRLDVRQAPMIRGFVTEDLAQDQWLLQVVWHHLIGDHTTLELVVEEVQALLAGRATSLPVPMPFRNMVAQARLGVSPAEHEAFFTELLGSVTEPTLPFGLREVYGDGADIREASCPVAPGVAQQVRQQARRLGVSAASLLHVAWAQVVARISGRTDVVFGTVVFGRMAGSPGADRVPGLFINTLPIRLDVGQGGVAQTVTNTHALLTRLLHHEHASLALAQRCSGIAAPQPLFAALLNYRHSPQQNPTDTVMEPHAWAGITILHAEERTNYPVTVSVDDLGEGFSITAQVSAPIEAQRVCGYLHTVLEHLVEALETAPETPVHQLDVLPLGERQQLLVDWNATAAEYPATQTIQELFEAQVARTPEAVAVVYEGQQLTYGALNARANQLARHLRTLGVGPDRLVGLCVERSLEMIVGLLGILKAGGAYVPLDPTYPTERLRYMLTDSQPVVVLTQAPLLATLPATEIPTFYLDTQWATVATYPSANLEHHTCPAHLAYVLYTSGSTGRPKGVEVPHHNVVRLFAATDAWFRFTADDTWTLFHSYAFDFSVWEIWGALLAGGKLVVVPFEVTRTPEAFYEVLVKAQVTVLNQTPTAFQAVMEVDAKRADPSGLVLRTVIFGGEALNPLALEPWVRTHGDEAPALINMYGITETTVHVTYAPLHATSHSVASIGRPISDLAVYILDQDLAPVPVGVAGELHIAGAGLARGYLGRPGLTAAKFVPNPFSEEPGARMYKSGDRARYQPDGNIEYLGRIDHQIKLRGFRIELGEIEAALSQHPGVREAVVVVREDQPGEQRLVAYVGVEGEALAIEPGDLRSQLAQTLPGYMVPSAFVVLEQFPLTPNGKVDRQALPAPEVMRGVRGYVAPRTPVEAQLAAIWAEVLQLDRVGVEDNFFELGGHSLLAITMLERLRQVGLATTVRALFTTPTIAAVAAAAGTTCEIAVPPNRIPAECAALTPDMLSLIQLTPEEVATIVATVPGGACNVQDIYPLAPLQEGLLFHHRLQAQGDAYLLPALLSFDTRERLDQFLQALQVVIARHDILRTAIVWEGLSAPVQVVWRQAPLTIEEILLQGDERAQQLQARYDLRQYRLDVRQAPMIRGFVTEDLAQDQWLLQVVWHHLIGDHTTLELVVEEVQALLAGRATSLPVPMPFRNMVAQARLGVSPAEHEAFFTELLGSVTEPTLPFGLREVYGDGADIREASCPVAPGVAQQVRQQARRLGVSAASLLHVAWAQVVARISGRTDVVFGTVVFGRMAGSPGADRVPGLFINTLPIRLDVGQGGVAQTVTNTHALLTRLLHHEHASLALAQRCSGIAAPQPLFAALLNYRHSPQQNPTDTVMEPHAWAGITILHAEERTNYPVTVSVDDLGEGFSITAQVSAPIEAQRVCGYLHTVLEHLVEALETAPETPVHQLDVLPLGERQQLLVDWNATAAEYPATQTIQELFEAQVARTPEAVAVVYEGQQLTYGALNARANQLARHLRTLGVGPDRLVGLCVERSLEMIVGLLGILKAGGAYVPLDPTYPTERLRYMLTDSQPVVVLTQAPLLATLPATEIPTFYLDTQWATVATYPSANLEHHTCPAHLAYVLYTSGSTGRPKGVGLSLAAVQNLIRWQIDQQNPGDVGIARILQFASMNFDVAFQEICSTLCVGNSLMLLNNSLCRDIQRLEKFILGNQVRRVFLPNAVLQQLASMCLITQSSMASKNGCEIITAGEQLVISESLRSYAKKLGGKYLYNQYGPSETHVVTQYQLHCSEMHDWPNTPPIGRPIANTQLYILDSALTPVPVGVAGELHIAGAGLARGYYQRSALTAEKFIPNPFSHEPGARMYKSGDRARYRPDGNIEYLGRIDHQVKLRGFRIELGEIEAALSQHPGVREAVVVVREDQPGEQRLVAYVGVEGEALAIEPGDLRSQLAQTLPGYMVPSAFVVLEQLPLTPNGKVDRQALPAPEVMRGVRGYVAPRTPVEAQLAAIWAEVLQLDRVGVEDNFFELGGHSLLATQSMSQVRTVFRVEIPLRVLFEFPTASALARKIEQCLEDREEVEV